jgi:ATP-dependent DNA helicase RecG
MSDILMLQERVKYHIQIGEGHYREFKSAYEGEPDNKRPGNVKKLCRYIAEALMAFANADGGELLVGVEDDGMISGIPHKESEIQAMLNAYNTLIMDYEHSPLPLDRGCRLELEGKTILFFSVPKGSTRIYQLTDGTCKKRKGKATEPVSFHQIDFERKEIKSREYDRQFVDGATVHDLDFSLLQSIADSYIRGIGIERYLQQIGLAEYSPTGLKLRRAALLLFAARIQKWHPRSQVRILRVLGTELKTGEQYNATEAGEVTGNIFVLVEKSWEILRPFLTSKTEFSSQSAKFEQKLIYPESACREALINAIAHRDYQVSNAIEVYIFTDRIEIKSPGPLLSTLTIKDLEELQGAHESRNVLVAKILRENDYMRELGEGIKRIFNLMEQCELRKPKLYSNATWFSVTLYHKSVFTEKQQQWLSLFASFPLTSNQKKIVVLGINEREISPDDIYRALYTEDRNVYDETVTPLRNAGILEPIRTSSTASQLAKQRNVPKKKIARFKVNKRFSS